jgi:sugar/nucleoside kinase (ribokinase family)
LPPGCTVAYGEVCAWTLARAHARSGDRIALAAYLGEDDAFARAIGEFAERYADQNERDHSALAAAGRTGRVEVQSGL